MNVVESIRGEYLRYKNLAESAMAQVDEERLSAVAFGREQLASRRSAGTCRGTSSPASRIS